MLKISLVFSLALMAASYNYIVTPNGTGQVLSDTTKNKLADSIWKSFEYKLPTIEDIQASQKSLETQLDWIANRELRNRKYRENGIAFWKTFPDDVRRFEWLEATIKMNQFPYYWKNVQQGAKIKKNENSDSIPVDHTAVAEWEKLYPSLRREYLSSPQVSSNRKVDFKCYELEYYIRQGKNPQYRDNNKYNLMHLKDLFISAASDFLIHYSKEKYEGIYNPFERINVFFSHRVDYNLAADDLIVFAKSVKLSSKGKLKEWADAKERYLSLYAKPIDWVFTTTNGVKIDLKEYRGKVVILDFWATWCKSCIAMMPKLKKLYDGYNSHGLEVISITLDHEDKMNAIMKVEHEIGASWPIVIIGGKNKEDEKNSMYRKLWDKYAFTGIPIILTFNKEGNLVEELGGFIKKDYEITLKQLLTE